MAAVLANADWRLLLAAPVSLALTRLLIGLAQRYQWVAKPKADRWHQKPTALYGGVAIFATFALGLILLAPLLLAQKRYDLVGLILGGVTIFGVGLRDDIKALNPLVKLTGQFVAIMPFLVGAGLLHNSTLFLFILPFAIFWMLTLTNAFNLLDNMDGLAAGAATIVASVLCLFALSNQLPLLALFSALMAASSLGFLWFNFRLKGSARIFMGDCGAMFLGYMLGGLTLLDVCPNSPDAIAAISVPLLIMALPIFDTTLVIILRKREGRAISQGGRDHSSHRLVYSGRTEKRAVLLLHALCLICGVIGVSLERVGFPLLTVMTLALVSALLYRFGVYLSRFSGPSYAVASPARAPQPDSESIPSP